MSSSLMPVPFKYAELQDGEATGKLKCLARNFASERKTQVQSILECGKIIGDASAILESAGRSSKFGKWVTSELGCSLHTAENYRNAFEVFGLQIRPGDLVHADRHGALVIPEQVLPELEAALEKMFSCEKLVLEPARQPGFDIDAFEKAWAAFEAART